MNYSRPIADATIRHVYVHVPFCSSICTFCALYSVVHHDAPARAYVSALKREIAMSAESMSFCEPDTIYFGGGTPTQLSEGLFEEMLVNIANVLRPGNDVEWSCECAPDSLTPAKLACM